MHPKRKCQMRKWNSILWLESTCIKYPTKLFKWIIITHLRMTKMYIGLVWLRSQLNQTQKLIKNVHNKIEKRNKMSILCLRCSSHGSITIRYEFFSFWYGFWWLLLDTKFNVFPSSPFIHFDFLFTRQKRARKTISFCCLTGLAFVQW